MWVGMWHGGANYSAPYAEDSEEFGTLADAVESHRSKYRNADGRTPCVSEDSETWLYGPYVPGPGMLASVREYIETDGYPDRIVKIGPRGGMRIERA